MLCAPFEQFLLERSEKGAKTGLAAQWQFEGRDVSQPDMFHFRETIHIECCRDLFQLNAGEAAAQQGSNSEKKCIRAAHVQAQAALFGYPS